MDDLKAHGDRAKLALISISITNESSLLDTCNFVWE
jgi:hypothetical protein